MQTKRGRVGCGCLLSIALLVVAILAVGTCYLNYMDEDYLSTITQNQSQTSTVQTIKKIAREYHESHIYISGDVYDCEHMSADVWNMLKAKGINAVIAAGNVEEKPKTLADCDHAWVLAEAEPGKWLAVECTGGYVVYKDDNPLSIGDINIVILKI